jgi:hypothetical protein
VLVYGVFAWGVLPRYGGEARDHIAAVRRDWLVAVMAFGGTLAVAVPTVIVAVR